MLDVRSDGRRGRSRLGKAKPRETLTGCVLNQRNQIFGWVLHPIDQRIDGITQRQAIDVKYDFRRLIESGHLTCVDGVLLAISKALCINRFCLIWLGCALGVCSSNGLVFGSQRLFMRSA